MPLALQDHTIDGVLLLDGVRFQDDRGFFAELYNQARMPAELPPFVQDNASLSLEKGVLRGLHFQKAPYAQGKFVTVLQGSIWDVLVDLRNASATFGKAYGVELSAENKHQLYIPEGFAHGFVTLEANTLVHYKTTAPYTPSHDSGIRWNDPTLAIDWHLDGNSPILSPKDEILPFFDSQATYF
jgi:dTDP-4-dehydrorhamnose 3,5-epimerase